MYEAISFSISFRIRHPVMDLECISKKLMLTPSQSWRVKEQRRTKRGEPLEGTYDYSYWTVPVPASASKTPSNSIMEFCRSHLEPNQKLLQEIAKTGGRIEFYASYFFEDTLGEAFCYELLNELGRLGIDLAMNCYAFLPKDRT